MANPFGDILLRSLEFRGRTGVVKKNRFRNPVRHDFFIQQIEGKFNAYSGETGRQDLPAVEAASDNAGNPVFLQSRPYTLARRFHGIGVTQLIERIEAAIKNDPDRLSQLPFEDFPDHLHQRGARTGQAAPRPESGGMGRVMAEGKAMPALGVGTGSPEGLRNLHRKLPLRHQPTLCPPQGGSRVEALRADPAAEPTAGAEEGIPGTLR